MFDKIFCLWLDTGHPFASPALCPVKTDRISLDITLMAYCYYHIFLSDQVIHINVIHILKDLCPPLIPIQFCNLLHFVLDDLQDHGRTL